ncbi:MAG: alpha/beta fold hydrolase [Desulfovibrio sp.]|nr:alpha/beta fold hydrolase [Desulfovibrio sp.]
MSGRDRPGASPTGLEHLMPPLTGSGQPEASPTGLDHLGPFFPGSRIGMLLLHGLAGTPSEMKNVAKKLNAYGFTVLCPLLAGHCATEKELVATTWQDWATSAASALEALSARTDAVFVGGLSAGAVLSLHLALQTPESIRGLALYSTTLRWDGWSITKLRFLLPLWLRLPVIGSRYRFREVYPYGIMNEKLRRRLHTRMQEGNAVEAGLIATPGVSLRELWRLVDKVKKRLHEIRLPSLLVHARNDDIADLRNALYVLNRLGGPAELMLLDRSYHMITVDQERDKVGDATALYCAARLSDAEKAELARAASRELPAAMPADSIGKSADKRRGAAAAIRRPGRGAAPDPDGTRLRIPPGRPEQA